MLQVTPEPNTLLSDAGPAALTGLNIIHKHLTGQEGTKQHMKVTGIIMECNPFHEGHAYILQEARRLTQADYIVVAMSGDYVQRGEPALYDKYIRAEEILRAGRIWSWRFPSLPPAGVPSISPGAASLFWTSLELSLTSASDRRAAIWTTSSGVPGLWQVQKTDRPQKKRPDTEVYCRRD